jgi:hypothetical protein
MKIFLISPLLAASGLTTVQADSPYVQGRLMMNLGVQRSNDALQADLQRIPDGATDGEPERDQQGAVMNNL